MSLQRNLKRIGHGQSPYRGSSKTREGPDRSIIVGGQTATRAIDLRPPLCASAAAAHCKHETARQFGDHILEAPRAFARNSTSISAGIDFGMTQLDRAPYKAHRRVIDVSGDGDNNSGREPAATRDVAIAKGITINGLVILTEPPSHSYSSHTNPPGGLANYYRNNVIGGAGAFVVVAENFNSFGNAITKKLIAEIAQAEPQQQEGSQNRPSLRN